MDKKEYREDFLKRVKEAEGQDFVVHKIDLNGMVQKEEPIYMGLSNYYGSVFAKKKDDGTYCMFLDDYSGQDTIEISKELYLAIKKEFGDKE